MCFLLTMWMAASEAIIVLTTHRLKLEDMRKACAIYEERTDRITKPVMVL